MHDILKLIDLKRLHELHKKQGFFYFSFFFDFRSRLYYHSFISLTNFKLSRFFYTEDDYTDDELVKIINNSVNSKASSIFIDLYNSKKDSVIDYVHEDYTNIKYANICKNTHRKNDYC